MPFPAFVLCVLTLLSLSAKAIAEFNPPPTLEETGLMDENRLPGPGVRAFGVRFPLWTDGAEKIRYLRLPAGTTIDNSDDDQWRFPEGSTLWKEFRVQGKTVETRVMHRQDGRWHFFTYNNQPDGSTALVEEGLPDRAMLDADKGITFDIPPQPLCENCHNTMEPLGFDLVQQSGGAMQDGNAGRTGLQGIRDLLRYPVRERSLSRARMDHLPRAEAALTGWLHGNCSSCHNPKGNAAWFNLRHLVGQEGREVLPALVNAPSLYPGRVRVVPGQPDRSFLLQRVGTRSNIDGLPPMPAFGSKIVDHGAVQALRTWIRSLPESR